MVALIRLLLALLASSLRSKLSHEAENAALRQQIIVLGRKLRGCLRSSDLTFEPMTRECSSASSLDIGRG